jgi:hypothetical protein
MCEILKECNIQWIPLYDKSSAAHRKLPAALLTKPSILPNVSTVLSTVYCTLSGSRTSISMQNNAAGNFLCAAEDLSYNGWHSVIDIVLNGTWHCTQAVGKEWIKNGQRGRIINMVANSTASVRVIDNTPAFALAECITPIPALHA